MTLTELAELAAAVLISLGGAGAVVFGFSSHLGKVWAERLMTRERATYDRELAELRNRLENQTKEQLAALEMGLSIFKDKHLRGFHDKLATYRKVIDLIAEVLGDFDRCQETKRPLPAERFDAINRERIKAYGYIGLLAPQSVMDAIDGLFDHLLLIAHGKSPYEWAKVRELALDLLNEARKDVGIDDSQIFYRGNL